MAGDDWSMEIDAESVHFGQDGLGDFDWSNKADDTPVSLALMATNSEGNSSGYVAFGNVPNGKKESLGKREPSRPSCIDLRKSAMCRELKFTSSICFLKSVDNSSLLRSVFILIFQKDWGMSTSSNINKLVIKRQSWLEVYFQEFQVVIILGLACRKGKHHRASCKKIEERTVREPLELLHMDLFRPVSVESVNRKKYCLVVTDDCSKFSWVFFLAYKDETYDMLHDLIVGLENKLRHKVKTIRLHSKNGVAERKNRTLIEAARTMLADSLLPIQFWAEAVNTACYVLNRVLINWVSLMASHDEGYLLGYSTSSKGNGLMDVSDLDHCLTTSMNYIPVRKENYADSGGQETTYDDVEDLDDQQFIVHGPSINAGQNKHFKEGKSIAKIHNDAQRNAFEKEKRRIALEKGKGCVDSTFTLSTANTPSQSTGNTPTDSDD
ncbi:putative ribonuclease H-like domain-containing protein [Tanacetum coccineum]